MLVGEACVVSSLTVAVCMWLRTEVSTVISVLARFVGLGVMCVVVCTSLSAVGRVGSNVVSSVGLSVGLCLCVRFLSVLLVDLMAVSGIVLCVQVLRVLCS